MPMTATIPAQIDYDTGWSVAVLAGETAVDVVHLCAGEASEISVEMVTSTIAAMQKREAFKIAQAKDDELFAAIDDADDSEAAEAEWERYAVSIRFGMASGGVFTHTFSKAEAKRAGIQRL